MQISAPVAIVDDEEAIRDALYDLLHVEGIPAVTFESAKALLAGDVDSFSCIIADVRMPGIDGLQLQQRLRQRGSRIPIIFITSSTEEALRTRALKDGAVAWFMKPVADETLLVALRSAIDPDCGGQ